jgi:Polysaccharide pyruvyl transferase
MMGSVRVGILSATLGHVPNSFLMPTAEALEVAAGRNTGNLAFRYAVTQHIASPKVHVPWGADPGWVRAECDLLVIPSSNQANPGTDFSHGADFLEAVDLPCLPLGLGAQAPDLGAEVAFPPGTHRYLRSLSERSRQIGVRGDYTADVLAKAGVRNTVVIGCPSNFINTLSTLGAVIERKLRHGVFTRLVVTAGDLTPAHRKLERKLFAWLLSGEGAYVCQSHPGLVSLARNRLEEVTKDEADQIRRYLQTRPLRLRPRSKFLATARQEFRVFFDAGAWLERLASFDLAVGVRFHGNLLAVQAATPGVCIYHDARTQELCGTTALPSVSVKDFMSARRPRDLVEVTAFDGSGFDKKRATLAREYRTLLVGSGVGVNDHLTKLTRPGC